MLGTCTAPAEVSPYKQTALVAKQHLGSSHKCLLCTWGTDYLLLSFLGGIGASIYPCSGVCLWSFGLEANMFLALICVLNHQSNHILLSPFCFRSVCKSNKCLGSEIRKLEETGNRRMSFPQYVTFPSLKWSALAGSYHSQSNLILLPWMTCAVVLNWILKSSQKWCMYHSLCLYSIKAYGVMETSRN